MQATAHTQRYLHYIAHKLKNTYIQKKHFSNKN